MGDKMNREDLLTILCAGIHVAKVDENLDSTEKKLLSQLVEAMKLTEEERVMLTNRKLALSELIQNLSSD